MANKRILICADNFFERVRGGGARSAWEIALELGSRGYDVSFLIRGTAEEQDSEERSGIKIYRHKNRVLSVFRFLRVIGPEELSAVNFQDPYSSFLVLLYLILKRVKTPRIYTFQSPWPVEYAIRAKKKKLSLPRIFFGVQLRRELEKFVLKNSDKVTVASDFMRKELLRLHSLEADILPLGVNLKRFTPPAEGEALPEGLKAAGGGKMFFTLRNLEPRMGLENLLGAVKILSDRGHEKLSFIIGGVGSLETELKETAGKLNIADMVSFPGYIPDGELRLYYGASDAFILPTRELEGFGLVTLEAMACGCPVLATPVGANPEVAGVCPGNVIFKSGKAEDIAEGIEEFIKTHPEINKRERERCRRYAEDNYSWKTYADGFEGIFEKL
ncbi:MAG: hypothetical protein COT17_01260 [Elusimicrobia bacterium CG08_land_8_20_14_0_20_51_18]|nr:MAG: hypothetical protein COT17_01260 [Elusimicrobia bacterium CG08_land_8_20_14_0_20_51_18]